MLVGAGHARDWFVDLDRDECRQSRPPAVFGTLPANRRFGPATVGGPGHHARIAATTVESAMHYVPIGLERFIVTAHAMSLCIFRISLGTCTLQTGFFHGHPEASRDDYGRLASHDHQMLACT
jgi:hypothetical protein